MSLTKIEWTDRTWNPITGCTKVSPGCDNCYAENIAHRFAGAAAFPNGFDLTLRPGQIDAPLRWRTPARIFVNSMSDLFHDQVPDEFIARVFAVMAAAPQHTYQVLTKRHGRMRALLRDPAFRAAVLPLAVAYDQGVNEGMVEPDGWWPLDNVWLGVSVEDQKRADLRIPALLDTPAAVRFLSCEPLLESVDLAPALLPDSAGRRTRRLHGLPGYPESRVSEGQGVDWVIVGGESGPGARPLDVEWVRALVEQCESAGVPVFVKQLGSKYGPSKGGDIDTFPEDLRLREFPAPVGDDSDRLSSSSVKNL